ncbi:hypothetical protein [Deinococcus rufus]|uniref:Uncharacterized protein n=1 Tax=Deinococcus rufus TaxID=2136097 RepID=A0ABV7Z8U1_9DEIO
MQIIVMITLNLTLYDLQVVQDAMLERPHRYPSGLTFIQARADDW